VLVVLRNAAVGERGGVIGEVTNFLPPTAYPRAAVPVAIATCVSLANLLPSKRTRGPGARGADDRAGGDGGPLGRGDDFADAEEGGYLRATACGGSRSHRPGHIAVSNDTKRM
jgi:hypothetical protein